MLLNPTKGYASACRCQMAQKQRKKEEKEIGSAPFAPQKNKRKKQCRRKGKKGDCAAYRIHRFGFKMRTEHPFQNSAAVERFDGQQISQSQKEMHVCPKRLPEQKQGKAKAKQICKRPRKRHNGFSFIGKRSSFKKSQSEILRA